MESKIVKVSLRIILGCAVLYSCSTYLLADSVYSQCKQQVKDYGIQAEFSQDYIRDCVVSMGGAVAESKTEQPAQTASPETKSSAQAKAREPATEDDLSDTAIEPEPVEVSEPAEQDIADIQDVGEETNTALDTSDASSRGSDSNESSNQ